MTAPASTDIIYRDASGESVRLAARRLAAGFGLGSVAGRRPDDHAHDAGTREYDDDHNDPGGHRPPSQPLRRPPSAPVTTVSAPTAPTTSTGTTGGGVAPG